MMMKPFNFLIAFAFLAGFNAFGQISIIHTNNPVDQPLKNGAFYVLPQTTLKIDVVVRADEKIKGPYSDYAERFFGMENINSFSYTTYSIEKIIVTSISEPDPEQLYYVEPGEKDARDPRPFRLMLNNSGFPVAANNLNLNATDEKTGTIEMVLVENANEKNGEQVFHFLPHIKTQTDTIIRRVTVGTEITEQSFYRMRLSNLTTEEMAVKALERIEEIRDMKFKLLTGFQETAYDEGTMRFMYDNLTSEENELFDLFRGKSAVYYEHYTFYHTPAPSKNKDVVDLFRFSGSEGITSGRGSGKFVQLELNPMGLGQLAATFPESGAKNGFAYRVPGFAGLKVKLEEDVFFENKLTINQYGVVKRLPSQRFDASFHPETGSLKSVLFE
jgi:hypothetical protein